MRRRAAGVLVAGIGLLACRDATTPEAPVAPPESVRAEALGMRSVRIEWTPVEGADVVGYRVFRRIDLTGAFTPTGSDPPQRVPGPVVFVDVGVEPERTYGYRVVALTRLGGQSLPSTVAGARTPPEPGIRVRTVTTASAPGALDRDGYSIVVAGAADTIVEPIAPSAERRFSPLPAGAYRVVLRGLAPQCQMDGDTVQDVPVTDQGVHTLAAVNFLVRCRDPRLGAVRVDIVVDGDSVDVDGMRVTADGIVGDSTAPGGQRAVTRSQHVDASGGTVFWDDLPPGSYQVTLDSLAPQCVASGGTRRDVTIGPLTSEIVEIALSCQRGDGTGTNGRPFVWRNEWSAASAAAGARVSLDVSLDLSARAGQSLGAVQAELRYPAAVLRYDSASARALADQFVANASMAGVINWLALETSTAPTGAVALARFHFTVIGAAGARGTTRTSNVIAAAGDLETSLDTLVRVVEDTILVGAGAANQPPVAEAGGPYSSTVGALVTLSAAGSFDPDGTIASYVWTFGDGASGSGAAPSHAYAAAGTYQAVLTVTDAAGAADRDTALVTIVSAGSNQPPRAEANGPYAGTVGATISFSANGSADPDGTIASYVWSFGDGATASGMSVSHAYASPGTHTVTLVVTDDRGATARDSALVTVAAGGSAALIWSATFGAVNASDNTVPLTIEMDLSADLAATPGPEALESWVVDSLRWNPAVLQYHAFNFGTGGGGSVNPTDVARGKLAFRGSQGASNRTGRVTIAIVRFKVIGARGATTTTSTAVGNLVGTAATGAFNYRAHTTIGEGTFTIP